MSFAINNKAVAEIHENVEQSPYLLEVLSATDALVVKSPLRPRPHLHNCFPETRKLSKQLTVSK